MINGTFTPSEAQQEEFYRLHRNYLLAEDAFNDFCQEHAGMQFRVFSDEVIEDALDDKVRPLFDKGEGEGKT